MRPLPPSPHRPRILSSDVYVTELLPMTLSIPTIVLSLAFSVS